MPLLGQKLRTFDEAEAEGLYVEGWTLAMLAERYAVSRFTVRDRLKQRGVSLRVNTGNPADRDWDAIAKEYKAGAATWQLALKYHVCKETILNRLRDMGVHIRSSKEAKYRSGPRKPKCSKCGLVLEEMAWHKDGVCCACWALEQGDEYPLGRWIWANS